MNDFTSNSSSARITVVDALRGFAIMSIMLLHNLEHFDVWFFPANLPTWIKAMDGNIWSTMFFLFSGKSYAIFALLFGFTFFIMFDKQDKKGLDFRGRFMWRMLLLLGFGIVNSIFYQGDILALYAVLSVSLVLVCKLSNRAVLITAIILMLQPLEWGKFIYMLYHPDYVAVKNISWQYFGKSSEYIFGDSFLKTAWGNLTNGRWGCVVWSFENGRFFQASSLFMMGMLLGRKRIFELNQTKFWKISLVVAVVSFFAFFHAKGLMPKLTSNTKMIDELNIIFSSWSNFALMAVWVSGFILLYQLKTGQKLLSKLEPFGKMSLTNYVMQSIMGSIIYYGFGFSIYKYTGASYCLLIGIVLFILQLEFCKWWLKSHKQGPLEALWHKLTWISFKKKAVL